MSRELYACLFLREFPLQSQLRLRPELENTPVAVMDGRPPLETVCSANHAAHRIGTTLGMTRVEAESIQGLRLLSRSPEIESTAGEVFLECAASFSPRIEEKITGAHKACVLDIAGTERLFGPSQVLASLMHDALAAVGLRAAVAVSANFHTTLLKAAVSNGVSVIAEGREAEDLAPLPIDVLGLQDKEAETFSAWGIQTLGELAALSEVELIARLGQQGKRWRDLASGKRPHLFQPAEPKLVLKEYNEFEPPVEHVDSLLFVSIRMIDSLVLRVSNRALLLAVLSVTLRLEDKRSHSLTIRPALPTIDRKFLLKLLQIELAAHPPLSGVIALTIEAETGNGSKVQLGLFSPQLPEPSRLDVTLTRLKAIVGDDMVGSPVLEDSLRSDAFHMEAFSVAGLDGDMIQRRPRMALRRMRPPHPVRVRCSEHRPVAFHDGQRDYSIFVAYGPWKTSGCWWAADDWERDEWDVLIAQEQQAYLLVNDRRQSRWYLEAVYD